MLRILKDEDYKLTPWKNGGGVTKDVLLLPEGATQEDFDIRLSLAPIDTEGPFSCFSGIDRRITRLSETALALRFGDDVRTLERLKPFHFDSVQQPVSVLPEGPALVFNVMTRRGVWMSDVLAFERLREFQPAAPDRGIAVVYAVSGRWDTPAGNLEAGATLLLRDGAAADLRSVDGGDLLFATIVEA